MKKSINALLCVLGVFIFIHPAFSQETPLEFSFGAKFMDPDQKAALIRELPPVNARGHFDWRDLGAVTPAENQMMCGGCWAFALTGVMESAIFLEHDLLFNLSQQYLLTCSYDYYLSFGVLRFLRFDV